MPVNCAGIPETLLESELFGHVKGSFTGTVFLDEVGEMSMRMQVVLLRFLETGEIQRIGADRSHGRVNVRLITATNRDLQAHIASGEFREDLFFRLNVMHLHLPPLRERTEDIPLLFDYYLQSYSEAHRVEESEVSPDVMDALLAYRWPGNIRELKNVVERMVVKTRGRPMTHGDVPSNLVQSAAVSPSSQSTTKQKEAEFEAARAKKLVSLMLDEGESFWSAVHPQFMSRDMTRSDLRRIVQMGLECTNGNYRMMVRLFNMAGRGLQAVSQLPSQARLPPALPAIPRGAVAAPARRIDRRRQVVALSLICPCQLHPLRCRRRRGQPGWDSLAAWWLRPGADSWALRPLILSARSAGRPPASGSRPTHTSILGFPTARKRCRRS